MITKTIKLNIYPSENKLDKNKIYREMQDISYNTRRACNHAMNLQFSETMRQINEKEELGKARKFKDIHGVTFKTWLYHQMEPFLEGYTSGGVGATCRFVTSKANYDSKAILKGEESLSTFKSNMPIFVHNGSYEIYRHERLYYVNLALFTQDKNRSLGQGANQRINFAIAKTDNNIRTTLDRIMSKEYKQGAAQIQYDKRKKKWYMSISFSFEPEKRELNNNKILGVDLGIVNVAAMSAYDSEKKCYDWMKYSESIIDGMELVRYRQRIEARRKSMYEATKWASENKSGHGRKQRTRDAEKIGDKYAKFKDTYNHKISRHIVDMAIKHDCGIIQMENLSKFNEGQRDNLLANWSYFDLQTKVEYKAKEKGIMFNLINPKYTSQRCSKCGCIDGKNRDGKVSQANFKCVECGHAMNADINASRNIALPDIEILIEDYMKEKKKNEGKSKKAS